MCIGRCLLSMQDKGMTSTPDSTKDIDVYLDTDFAGGWDPGDPLNGDNVNSRTGYVIWYTGCPIYWQSKFNLILLCPLLKPSILNYLRLWERSCHVTNLMEEINVILFTYQFHGLLSRSMKIISHVLQWQIMIMWNSLLRLNTMQLGIIIFASMWSLSQILRGLSKSIIFPQRTKLQIYIHSDDTFMWLQELLLGW